MVWVISADPVFAGMLVTELKAAGFEAERSENFPKRTPVVCAVVDLDTCENIPVYCKYAIGFSKNLPANEQISSKCAVILQRPFLLRELFSLVGQTETQSAESRASTASVLSERRKEASLFRLGEDQCSFLIDGNSIPVSPGEFRVLEYLFVRKNKPVSEEALEALFDGGDHNLIRVYICRLRQKIRRYTNIPLIITLRGKGYSLNI